MKAIVLLVLIAIGICTANAQLADADGMRRIAKFVVSAPAPGTYLPWPGENEHWYAGEIITITNSSFRYTRFSDASDDKVYTGPLVQYKDHIYFDHKGVPDPYRIAGTADGQAALLTQEGYQQWKMTGKVFELNIVYLHREPKSRH